MSEQLLLAVLRVDVARDGFDVLPYLPLELHGATPLPERVIVGRIIDH